MTPKGYTLEDVALLTGGTVEGLIEEIEDDRKWRAGQPERDRLRAIEEEKERLRKEEWLASLKAQAEAHQRNQKALSLLEQLRLSFIDGRKLPVTQDDIAKIYGALTGDGSE